MDGYRTLKAGQPVRFEIIQGPKGLHAVNIQSHETAEPATRLQTEDTAEEAHATQH
jgi:CspA family cold shock protein